MKYLLAATALAAGTLPLPALAQAPLAAPVPADDEQVVVTGTRSDVPVPIDQTGASVTLIDDDALHNRQVRQVSDVLRDVPGVAVSRIAGQTQVRLRGTEANQTLVLIDGIEVSDPYAGEFDFGTLTADEAARVEVLRGQQSALYGSDAIGGVIQYVTLSGRELPGYSARVEGGSFGTVNAAARAAGVAGDADYALSGTINTTDGTSNSRFGGRDLKNDAGDLSFKGNWRPSDTATLTAVARWSRTDQDFNDTDADPTSPTFGYIVDTPGDHVRQNGLYGLVRGQVDTLGGRWTHALTAQIASTIRNGYGETGRTYGDHGQRYKGSYETTFRIGDGQVRHLLTGAVDVERENYRNTDPTGYAFTGQRHTNNLGLVGEYTLLVGQRASLGGAVRYDDNSRFEDTTTYRIQGSYRFPEGTRFHAAAGSGVKNPGFYELYGYVSGRFTGNESLKPERSEGWEAGVEQDVVGERIKAGATFFHAALKDEIYTTYPAPAYVAVPGNRTDKSRQNGVETYLNARFGEQWRVDAAYTYLHARENDLPEVRRPNHIASIAATWTAPGDRASITAVARYNGSTDDLAYTDPSYVPVRVRLDDYVLVNLDATYRLSRHLGLFGRIENAFDQHYEDVFSFTNSGIAAYAGIRARL